MHNSHLSLVGSRFLGKVLAPMVSFALKIFHKMKYPKTIQSRLYSQFGNRFQWNLPTTSLFLHCEQTRTLSLNFISNLHPCTATKLRIIINPTNCIVEKIIFIFMNKFLITLNASLSIFALFIWLMGYTKMRMTARGKEHQVDILDCIEYAFKNM